MCTLGFYGDGSWDIYGGPFNTGGISSSNIQLYNDFKGIRLDVAIYYSNSKKIIQIFKTFKYITYYIIIIYIYLK